MNEFIEVKKLITKLENDENNNSLLEELKYLLKIKTENFSIKQQSASESVKQQTISQICPYCGKTI